MSAKSRLLAQGRLALSSDSRVVVLITGFQMANGQRREDILE